MNNGSTICAIATLQGNGAIAIIRLSGEKAVQICDKVFYVNQPPTFPKLVAISKFSAYLFINSIACYN